MPNKQEVKSPPAAVARAIRLTQLDIVSSRASARIEAFAEYDIPFLAQLLRNKRVWRVEFGSGALTLKSARPGLRDKYPREFVVLLDEETGEVVRVASKFKGEAPDMRPEPSAESAEGQLRAVSEMYHGIPAVDPKFSFLEALDALQRHGVGSPLLAKEIDGLYVLHSQRGSAPRPVWIITLRGLPPVPGSGPYADSEPVWQANHYRNVVDAMTGKCLFATNFPLPAE